MGKLLSKKVPPLNGPKGQALPIRERLAPMCMSIILDPHAFLAGRCSGFPGATCRLQPNGPQGLCQGTRLCFLSHVARHHWLHQPVLSGFPSYIKDVWDKKSQLAELRVCKATCCGTAPVSPAISFTIQCTLKTCIDLFPIKVNFFSGGAISSVTTSNSAS